MFASISLFCYPSPTQAPSILCIISRSSHQERRKTTKVCVDTPTTYLRVHNINNMQRVILLLLVTCNVATVAFVPSHYGGAHHSHPIRSVLNRPAGDAAVLLLRMAEEPVDEAEPEEEKSDGRYDVSKLVGGLNDEDGAGGFNQFDPVLSATGFLSRRFGIVGGLAIFAALFAVEGGEILKALDDTNGGVEATGAAAITTTTPSGLKITEVKIGRGGNAPLPGYVIGIKAKVSIGDKVIYDTTAGDNKPVAFKYGQRPFQNVICEGVEEGIKGMKVGGKRVLDVPSNLAPPGVELPPGVPLIYEVELTEVLSGYF